MAARDLRSYFTSVSKDKKACQGSCTSIPRLVKATQNVTAADASAVNAELESFSKKKERQGSHTILIYLLVSKKTLENMHTPTEHKLLIKALNQSTLTTLFYVQL